MPTPMRHKDSGKVKYAQDWEVESYKEAGYVADSGASQDDGDGEGGHVCDVCDREFSSERGLASHKGQAH